MIWNFFLTRRTATVRVIRIIGRKCVHLLELKKKEELLEEGILRIKEYRNPFLLLNSSINARHIDVDDSTLIYFNFENVLILIRPAER
jgi:hypothetical protein